MRGLTIVTCAALLLAGCTVSQEIKNQCLAMGLQPGTDKFVDCQMRLTEASMSAQGGGGAPIMPPTVNFQPLPMPQRYGPQTVNVQANCTTTGYGNMTNTVCN
jgi:hypothetical protein